MLRVSFVGLIFSALLGLHAPAFANLPDQATQNDDQGATDEIRAEKRNPDSQEEAFAITSYVCRSSSRQQDLCWLSFPYPVNSPCRCSTFEDGFISIN